MNRRTCGVWGGVALVLILLAAYLYGFTVPRTSQSNLTPTVEDGRGWEVYALEGGGRRALAVEETWDFQGTFYLERVIPPEWTRRGDSRIALDAAHRYYVFVDGAPVYTNCPGASGALPVSFPAGGTVDWQSRPGFFLSSAWEGRTLTVAVAHAFAEGGGSPMMLLTSDPVEAGIASAHANGNTIPAVLFAALGALLLVLFAYSLLLGSPDPGLPVLAAAALAHMLYNLSQLQGSTAPGPLFLQAFLLVPLLYCALRMKRRRAPFLVLLLVCWGLASAAVVLEYFWDIPPWLPQGLSALLLLLPFLTFLPMGGLVWLGAGERRDGNPAFRLLIPGLCGCLFVLGLLFLVSIPVSLAAPQEAGLLGWLNYAVMSVFHWGPWPLLHLLGVLLLLALFLTAALDQIQRGTMRAEEVKLLAMKNTLALESIRTLERSGEALAVARHDQLHHLHVLASMCRENPEEAARYAASLASELSGIPPLRFTENSLVNTILTVQSGKAAQRSVRFLAQALLPERLSIQDQDLCSVLMNLLDNAGTAAARSAPESERLVRVGLSLREGYLLISIENTLPGDFDQEQFRRLLSGTAVPGRDGHGFGIRSARMVLSRYGGDLRYCVKDGLMTVNAAMELDAEAPGAQAG